MTMIMAQIVESHSLAFRGTALIELPGRVTPVSPIQPNSIQSRTVSTRSGANCA